MLFWADDYKRLKFNYEATARNADFKKNSVISKIAEMTDKFEEYRNEASNFCRLI